MAESSSHPASGIPLITMRLFKKYIGFLNKSKKSLEASELLVLIFKLNSKYGQIDHYTSTFD
jgi:hypothetical protein